MMQLISSVKRRMSSARSSESHASPADTPTAQNAAYIRSAFLPANEQVPEPGDNSRRASSRNGAAPRTPTGAPNLQADDPPPSKKSTGHSKTKKLDIPSTAPVPAAETDVPKSPHKARNFSNASDQCLPPGLIVRRANPDSFAAEPSLRDVPAAEVLDVLKRKLFLCANVIFDFKPASSELWLEEKEAKKSTLIEILDFVNNADRRPVQLEQVVEELIEMISANIFRPLPPPSASVSTLLLNDPEEMEPILEVSWPHLQLVYEILLRFVMSNEVNPKTAKKYIDHCFVLKLLELFGSEDPRERDYLKTIMHRVYGKIMALRAFIRKAIQHVFFRYIHENDCQYGVSELLEILGSIINGFAQPLKEEHKLFLTRSMIPLHKSRHLVSYHQQLTYCMTQYIEKDNHLVEPIIKGLLRYWPVTNTPKEVLFLNEVEEILELTPPAEFVKIMDPLFRRMALCIQSPHFQVSERVLFLWNNPRIVKLINQNKNQLFPIVIGALYKNTKDHWNVTVHGLTFNVCKLLAEADPNLFDHCNDENMAKEERKSKNKELRQQTWLALKMHYQSESPPQ